MPTPTFTGSSYQISPGGVSGVENSAAVTALEDGRYVAVYRSSSLASGSLAYVIYNADGTIAKRETVVNPDDESFIDSGNVNIAALKGGGFAIVWGSRSGTDENIYHRVYAPDGSPLTTPVHTNADATEGVARKPNIVSDGQGGFYVVWQDNGYDNDPGPGVTSTFVPRMQHFGSTGQPLDLPQQLGDAFGADTDPAIAINDDGSRINVIWDDNLSNNGSDTDGIKGFEFGGLEDYRADSGDYSEWHMAPDVAYSTGNNFMAVWTEYVGLSEGYAVFGAINGGDEFQINTSAHKHSFTMQQVVGLQSGNFLVVWYDGGFDGNDDVLGQLFSVTGEKIGVEFQISDRASTDISRIAASEMLDGRVVVTWDTTGNGINAVSRMVDVRQSASDWTGTAAGEHYVGTRFVDTLNGAGGDDTLQGLTGADTLTGGSGHDTASYSYASKGVIASLTNAATNTGDANGDTYSSIENLTGSRFSDRLEGNGGANLLNGLAGDDTLEGAAGKDVLVGGLGVDKLYGGASADLFVFATGDTARAATKADTIYDFSSAQADTIDLSLIDAVSATARDNKFTFIGSAAFSDKAGELRVVREKSDTWVTGDTDGDGRADFTLHLDDAVALRAGNFEL